MFSPPLRDGFIATERAKVIAETLIELQRIRRQRRLTPLALGALRTLERIAARWNAGQIKTITHEEMARPVAVAQAFIQGVPTCAR